MKFAKSILYTMFPMCAWAVLATAAAAQNAVCVSTLPTNTGGVTHLTGKNECGIPVQFNICAAIPGMAKNAEFSKMLRADETWSLDAVNPKGQQPDITSNYCRIGQTCPVTCAAAQMSGVVWTRRPMADIFANAYPQRAAMNEVNGKVILECVIQPNLIPGNCTIFSEMPAGFGFGDAALKLARQYRAASLTADGKSAVGVSRKVGIDFRLY